MDDNVTNAPSPGAQAPEPAKAMPADLLRDGRDYKDTIQIAGTIYAEAVSDARRVRDETVRMVNEEYQRAIDCAVEEHDAMVAAAKRDFMTTRKAVALPPAPPLVTDEMRGSVLKRLRSAFSRDDHKEG